MRKYLAAAMAAGLEQDGPPPDEVQLNRLAGISRTDPKRVETPVEDSLIPWGTAALDRLGNTSCQIVIKGSSYRERLSPHRALLEAKGVIDRPTPT